MSILIKDMKMPAGCIYRENGHLTTCPLYDVDGYCGALGKEASHEENNRHPDCPLVELPPHGRLIDADVLPMNMDCPRVEYEDLVKATTIIEAEGEE